MERTAQEIESANEPAEPRSFTSTYSDTSDLRLARLGITLASRIEDGRSLWELTLPPGTAPLRIEAAGEPAAPPPKLARLLTAVVAGRELQPVATLRTRMAENDAGVVETIDVIEAQQVAKSFAKLRLDGSGNGASALHESLRAGPERTQPAHTLLRTLGFVFEDQRTPRTVRSGVEAMARAQRTALLAADPGARLGTDPEHVHQFRVAVRRLRALLRSARPLLDREWADELRSELDWLGRAAGSVRDFDVLLEYVRGQLRTLEPLDARGARRLAKELGTRRRAARASLRRVLEGDRYLALAARLEEPVRFAATVPRSVEQLPGREFRKLRKLMKTVGPASRDDELHALRIKVKRARYAAELDASLGSGPAGRFVRHAKKLQDVLGEHQDAIVAEARLRELVSGDAEGESLAAGRLVERQHGRRAAARRQFPRVWKKLERSGKQAWG